MYVATHFILTKQLRKMRQRQRQRTGTRSRPRRKRDSTTPPLPRPVLLASRSTTCERSDDLSEHSTYRLAYA